MSNQDQEKSDGYKKGSLSLAGAIAMGTGVMIGAGVFALTGQIAEQAGRWFPLAFLAAGVVSAFSAYSYIKISQAHPSAGGIAMYLQKAYGKGVVTAGMALLMYFSMVINESLVARTFGTYTVQLFTGPQKSDAQSSWWIPALAVGLLMLAFVVNLVGSKFVDRISLVMAILKVGGLAIFAIAGLWASGFDFAGLIGQSAKGDVSNDAVTGGVLGFLAATSLGVLAYKGFTTITNDGDELKDAKKNVARAIMISLGLCVTIYLLMAVAVGGNLSIPQIIASRDYALAEAAKPAFGQWGLWLTVALAIIATISGVIASVFAVSRMLAMLVKMQLIPFARLGIPGRRQYATLTYTIVLAIILAVSFDLARIASLGAIFYLIMDIAVQWGVLQHLRKHVGANAGIVMTSLVLDVVVLGGFIWVKATSDPLLLGIAGIGLLLIFIGETVYLKYGNSQTAGERS